MSKIDAVQSFKKEIHRQRFPRSGLAIARAKTRPADYPKIVSTLGTQQIYRGLFALSAFPPKLSNLVRNPRLGPISAGGEFVWTACVLRLYTKKLNQFLSMKEDFSRAFLNSNYDAASTILDKIEEEFGVSLWYIQYRLQLLQFKNGLEAQKDYLEKLLATEGINSLSAWVAYFFSLRTEENVSFAKLYDELADTIEEEGIGDYVINHVIPYDISLVTHPDSPITWEESNPIIDRFETFVSMLQLAVVRSRDAIDCDLKLAIDQLTEITDPRIQRINQIIGKRPDELAYSDMIQSADAYTIGKYEHVVHSDDTPLEIIARSRALSISISGPKGPMSLKEQIIDSMHEILTLTPQAQQHRLSLKKLALSCPKHTYSTQISQFLERNHDFVFPDSNYSELDYIAAINGPLENPWTCSLFSNLDSNTDWLRYLLSKYPDSPSLLLREILSTATSGKSLDKMANALPEHRFNMYQGHIEYVNNDLTSATLSYSKVVGNDNIFIASHAKRYLYDALHSSGKFAECLSLVVSHVLENQTAVFAYPISELAKDCLDKDELASDINLAILLHLNVVHVHHKWERDLSDVFENVLYKAGVEKPSELLGAPMFPRAHSIYFLRNICIPRILDDTTCFESVDEIEIERIAICQHLLSFDPLSKDEYLSEIRGITRDINVARLLKKVQTSKIYVDEAGLRQAFETSLFDTFLRYQKLLSSPDLAYQAEKLSKRLEEMLAAKGNTDIKDLKLPASEREALFETLLDDFTRDFAFNPAYGLDTHVSTTIRHGAFEGHIRNPFAAEDLLCKKKDKEYVLPRAWQFKLENLSSTELEHVRRHLGRFTQKIEELIGLYLSEKIRVKEPGTNGMFILSTNESAIRTLRETITKATDYHSFLDKFFAHAWQLVDESMEMIRHSLQQYLLNQVNSACSLLITTLEQNLSHEKIVALVDAIVRSQTAFQSGIVEVAEWFRRPQDLSRDPFDFEVAVHVALQQIKNCYVKTPLAPELKLHVHEQIDGKFVDGICEIFYILLQNVILHSGFGEDVIPVTVSAGRVNDTLIISCTNQLASDVDLPARRALANEAISKYERDTAMKLARSEGGSGLSKIWRIAEFDLRLGHKIDIKIDDDRSFTTTVTLSGIKVKRNADLHH